MVGHQINKQEKIKKKNNNNISSYINKGRKYCDVFNSHSVILR